MTLSLRFNCELLKRKLFFDVVGNGKGTRLYSSKMRTARALTVSPSMLCGGVSLAGRGVLLLGGLLGRGGLPGKGVLLGRGVLPLGGLLGRGFSLAGGSP